MSAISLLLAVVALLAIFRYCYPELEQDVRNVIGGLEISPVRQAFHTMADGLEGGASIKETIQETVKVLFG